MLSDKLLAISLVPMFLISCYSGISNKSKILGNEKVVYGVSKFFCSEVIPNSNYGINEIFFKKITNFELEEIDSCSNKLKSSVKAVSKDVTRNKDFLIINGAINLEPKSSYYGIFIGSLYNSSAGTSFRFNYTLKNDTLFLGDLQSSGQID